MGGRIQKKESHNEHSWIGWQHKNTVGKTEEEYIVW